MQYNLYVVRKTCTPAQDKLTGAGGNGGGGRSRREKKKEWFGLDVDD
jgi:hypothetical protein